ncbi:hypothetical protein, partial [uncultured Subdoligranulum sp.]|uniref:hypothetical protein n=1 Tax=uncultured Subdoligranulum sp. TaxID=512298 RepID=UPI0025E2E148
MISIKFPPFGRKNVYFDKPSPIIDPFFQNNKGMRPLLFIFSQGRRTEQAARTGGLLRLSKKVKNPLPAADMRRRWQHIQGNFTANCVGGHRPIA